MVEQPSSTTPAAQHNPLTTVSTFRIEAFSDAVLAIVITLLALELRVPTEEVVHEVGLVGALMAEWPSYLAFAASFLMVGAVWVNHHAMFVYIRRSNHMLLVLNLLLLMSVSTLPFTAALLADFIRGTAEEQRTVTLVYTGTFALGGLFFNAVWWCAMRDGLLDEQLSPETLRVVTLNYMRGPILYFVAFLLAFVSVPLSLALYGLLLLSFVLPLPSFRRRADLPPAPSEVGQPLNSVSDGEYA